MRFVWLLLLLATTAAAHQVMQAPVEIRNSGPDQYNTYTDNPRTVPQAPPGKINRSYRTINGVPHVCLRAASGEEVCGARGTASWPEYQHVWPMHPEVWQLEFGQITPSREDTGAIRETTLNFAPESKTCIQSKTLIPTGFDPAQPIRLSLGWETSSTTGAVTWSVAISCRDSGVARYATQFNDDVPGLGSADPNTSQALIVTRFTMNDTTGCTAYRQLFVRLCKVTDTLPRGNQPKASYLAIFIPRLP